MAIDVINSLMQSLFDGTKNLLHSIYIHDSTMIFAPQYLPLWLQLKLYSQCYFCYDTEIIVSQQYLCEGAFHSFALQ
jgi:hypothetical protein